MNYADGIRTFYFEYGFSWVKKKKIENIINPFIGTT